MEKTLYPLKFKPICKQMLWGGTKLRDEYGKECAKEDTGESWDISAFPENVSVVAEGFLAGNPLDDLIEVYMGDLVGDRIYDKFGTNFPLLIKHIHSREWLSVQVHPDDEFAGKQEGDFGKTEMWYILEAEKEASLIYGFNKDTSREEFIEKLNNRKLAEILNEVAVKAGDVFFMPAGVIHALGPGIVLVEIQQTSDSTYRIYDWDRVDKDGKGRELHLDKAMQVMDYSKQEEAAVEYDRLENATVNLVDCPFFTTGLIEFDDPVDKDFSMIDSFVIYVCTEGELLINYKGGAAVSLKKGESVLVPAEIKEISLLPRERSSLLEVYMKV